MFMDQTVKPLEGKILVTGGSGHVGANLVRRLLDDGHDVRCLVQPGTNNAALEGLEIERVVGDIRKAEDAKRAVEGCQRVFHVAAKVSTMTPSPAEEREIWDINVLGTRNIMRSALACGVERAVLTGSFSSVGFDPDDPSKPSNEAMPFYPFVPWLPYARSKVLAELETLRCVVDGLDAVIATSTGVIGPHDHLPSRLGGVFCDYVNGKLRAYIPGGIEFVSAHDLVEGHLLAMERGRTGHKYTFSTEFMTLEQLLALFGEVAGVHRKLVKLPARLMAGLARPYYQVAKRYFPDMPQRLTPGAVAILEMHRHADLSKAREELGFQPGSLRQAVSDAYEFFVTHEMMDPSRGRSVGGKDREEMVAAQ